VLPYDSIATAIEARYLITALTEATCVDMRQTAGAVVALLKPAGFDQAPVTDGDDVVGFAIRKEAESAPTDAPVRFHRLTSPYLVSASASVGTLLHRLKDVPMVFTVGTNGLTGFITPSDLGKQPVRTHFYLLLADLEMTMAAIARHSLGGGDKAISLLSNGRQEKVRERHREAKSFNLDADYLSAFEFSDLLTLIARARLFGDFGVASRSRWEVVTSGLTSFRDHVMHPTSEFLGKRTIVDLVRIEDELREMLLASRPNPIVSPGMATHVPGAEGQA
jgi:hypothetical protein